jgi:hypothetical protein
MNQFPVLSVASRDQQKVVKDIGVIGNVLGFRLIEIEQVSPRFREAQGIKVCKYKEIINDSDIDDPKRKYPYKIVGGQLSFVVNPLNNRAPVGTGRVAFLVDDNELLPPGALSGEERGWNREFLASHYATGYFRVIDPELNAVIKERHERILKASEGGREEEVKAAAVVDIAAGSSSPVMDAMKKLQEENKLLRDALMVKNEKKPLRKIEKKTAVRPKKHREGVPILDPRLPPDPKGYVEPDNSGFVQDSYDPVIIETEAVDDGNNKTDS